MKMKRVLALFLSFLLILSSFGTVAFADTKNAVAKVGNTEYATIEEAISNWTNGTTLTLLANVTLSDVITIKSTEHHILNLGTYTMTAASGKNAIVIKACGNGSAERTAITINADATNPGGINAGSKSVIYYKYADGGISTEDRPIIKINGGVFTGSTSTWGTAGIYTIGTAARKCATLNISGGTFNCTINGSGKSKLIISGGTFNYSVGSQGDSTALRLISGGTFKTFGFMTADSNNTKFWFGTSMGNSNVGVYVDDNGYIVVGGNVITEAGNTFKASSANYSGANNLLQYSSAKNNGLYYTSVEEAFADNNVKTGSVTVYVDELNMIGINYKGTIVVPEGEEITIIVKEGTTPEWKVTTNNGAVVIYTDAEGNVLERNDDGPFVEQGSSAEPVPSVKIEGRDDVEIVPMDDKENSYNISLKKGSTWNDGDSVKMIFPAVDGAADGDMAYIVHEHEDGKYIYVGEVKDGSITITNNVGFSTFTVNAGGLNEALADAKAMTGDVTVEIYDKVTLDTSLAGSYSSINFVGKDDNAEIYIDLQGYVDAPQKDVSFKDLKLSKVAGGHIANAGFMNLAFGVYSAKSVSYTNCIFVNGAYASFGTNTFTDCTFYKSHDRYGMWAYGSNDIVVDGCTFADIRGIKMYDEGGLKTTVLTVKNTDFSAVTDKPAIVLTYGASVNIEGNTYPAKGTFELDLDGDPNGTRVFGSDAEKAVCINDNGACGVLVDGKIYTTVAQAAEVAKEGSTVTLLHDSTETVELAEGVVLYKNGYEASGITVKVSFELEGEGTEESPYLIKSLDDLKSFRDDVNTGNAYDGKYVKLTVDIDLANENWIPIGSASADHGFMGNFDGNGYTISNLTIDKPELDGDGYAYAGLFGVTEGTDEDNQNFIKNLTIENVTINTTGHIVAAAIAYPYYTIVENVKVCGNINITGGDYTAGVLAYTRRCVNASNLCFIGSDGSSITGNKTVGGIISDIQMNGGLTAMYSNFNVSNVTINGDMSVGGISGIISEQTLKTCSVKNVTLNCSDSRVGVVSGSLGGDSLIREVTIDNVTGASGIIGADFGTGEAIEAKIGDKYYATVAKAISSAKSGETITVLADITQEDGIIITDKNLTIDLNNKTYTVTDGASTNNRNFKINGASVVTIKNGTMIAAGDYSSGAYGTVRTEGTANVTLENLKLYNYRGNGLNIKALTGTNVTMNNVEIYSQYGGGVEAAGGTIELNNVNVEQKGMYTAPYNSMAISVNGGGRVTVNSGVYSTECITAEEANGQGTSHGPWVAGVLNSGGTLVINGGTFSNDNFGENSSATYARGAILADTGANIQINGGTFNVLKSVIDIQNNLGDASKNPTGTISGGTFSADPTNSYVTIADGYKVAGNEDGTYGIVEAEVLNTKVGIVRNLTCTLSNNAEGYRVYLFAGIDSLNYKNVGYEVIFEGENKSDTSKVVYNSCTVNGTKYLPGSFGDKCNYIIAQPVDFGKSHASKSFKFRVFATKLDGGAIYTDWETVDKIYTLTE